MLPLRSPGTAAGSGSYLGPSSFANPLLTDTKTSYPKAFRAWEPLPEACAMRSSLQTSLVGFLANRKTCRTRKGCGFDGHSEPRYQSPRSCCDAVKSKHNCFQQCHLTITYFMGLMGAHKHHNANRGGSISYHHS